MTKRRRAALCFTANPGTDNPWGFRAFIRTVPWP